MKDLLGFRHVHIVHIVPISFSHCENLSRKLDFAFIYIFRRVRKHVFLVVKLFVAHKTNYTTTFICIHKVQNLARLEVKTPS